MNYSDMVEVNQSFPTWVVILVFALVVLEITLKAMALWRAAQNQSTCLFVFFIIYNTAGSLPLMYLLASKNPNKQ